MEAKSGQATNFGLEIVLNSQILDILIFNDKSMCLGNIQNSRYQIISFQHIKTN